jgi:hypothetical protein
MAFGLSSHAWYILIIHSTEPMMFKPKLIFYGLDSSIYECSLLLLCCVFKHIEFTCYSVLIFVYIPSKLQ